MKFILGLIGFVVVMLIYLFMIAVGIVIVFYIVLFLLRILA